jgi:hypothetical protein
LAGRHPPVHLRRRGSPRVSSRRNASLLIALGVGSLAATSLAAMVATSELLVESFGRPVSDRLEPPAPDLGRPGVIQVEPPQPGRGKPGGRSRAPAGEPSPRRGSVPRPQTGGGAGPEAAGGVVVVAVQRRPTRQERVAVQSPVLEEPAAAPPSPRPLRPDRPRPARPGPTRPPRPAPHPGGRAPCPERHRRDDDWRWSREQQRTGRDRRRHWHHRDARWPARDRSRTDHHQRRRDDERRWRAMRDRQPDQRHRRHCHRHHEPHRRTARH